MIIRKLKEKRGSTMIFGYGIIVLALFLTVLIIDIGNAYVTKIHLTHIGDAMALAGGNYGSHGYYNTKGEPRAIVKSDLAESKANAIYNANVKNLAGDVSVTKRYNPPEGGRTSVEQYFDGEFTVQLQGKVKTFLAGGMLDIPFLQVNHKAKVKVRPVS
jgi:Flp pilus assembly protein TadG